MNVDPSGEQTCQIQSICDGIEPCYLQRVCSETPVISIIPNDNPLSIRPDWGDASPDESLRVCNQANSGFCGGLVLSPIFGPQIYPARTSQSKPVQERNGECDSCPPPNLNYCRIDLLPAGGGTSYVPESPFHPHHCPPNAVAQLHWGYTQWVGPFRDEEGCYCQPEALPDEDIICLMNAIEVYVAQLLCVQEGARNRHINPGPGGSGPIQF